MGRSYRVELNKSESMRYRNLIADAKFVSVNLLESSEAGPHGTVNALPLKNICHGCTLPMRDPE
jgi:hypothetical protein